MTDLTDEQMETLADDVAERMLNAKDGEKEGKFEAKDVAAEVLKMLQEQEKGDSTAVYKTMFAEKYASKTTDTPGFGDYMDGTDDYGKVRKDELMKIESYDDRVTTLKALASAYNEASAGTAGRKPVVNVKARKKAQKAEDTFTKVSDKYDKGEYKTVGEFTRDYMNAISKEQEMLQ